MLDPRDVLFEEISRPPQRETELRASVRLYAARPFREPNVPSEGGRHWFLHELWRRLWVHLYSDLRPLVREAERAVYSLPSTAITMGYEHSLVVLGELHKVLRALDVPDLPREGVALIGSSTFGPLGAPDPAVPDVPTIGLEAGPNPGEFRVASGGEAYEHVFDGQAPPAGTFGVEHLEEVVRFAGARGVDVHFRATGLAPGPRRR